MKIEGAIFDLDGTLVNSMIWWDTIWDAVSAAHFGGKSCRPDRETEERMHTMFIGEAVVFLRDYYSKEHHVEIDKNDLLRTLDGDLEDFYRTRVKLKAGVAEFLQALQERGIPMCVASASERANIEIALDTCGIRKYFNAIFTCTEVGKGKNFPDIYYEALKNLGTPAETTWIFEDSYTALSTANSIGMHTVGIFEEQESHYEKMKAAATLYVDRGESMEKLIRFF